MSHEDQLVQAALLTLSVKALAWIRPWVALITAAWAADTSLGEVFAQSLFRQAQEAFRNGYEALAAGAAR